MRVVVTGVTGQVGGALVALPAPEGVEILPADRGVLDLSRPEGLAEGLDPLAPDLVVNCAAHTNVDGAEEDRETARRVNALAPGALAQWCGAHGAALIHLSTDYVFDGSGDRPWRVEDPVAPLGVYGATKEEGERLIRAAAPRHLILRTAWVYAARGKNFVRTMLRVGRARDQLRVVADQRGCPTAAEDLAPALMALITRLARGEELAWGTEHLCGSEVTSWHGFAEAIFALARTHWGRAPEVEAIPTEAYPTPARRPANSVLDGEGARIRLGLTLPGFGQSLPPIVAAIIAELEETEA